MNMNPTESENILSALKELQQGKMIVLTDDENRENEADLIFAAEHVNKEKIQFMLKHTGGIICLALTESLCHKLDLPLMVSNNKNAFQTAFTVSIEARTGISTGISAADRAKTIETAVADHASANDLVRPGHVFPLQAVEGGVFNRRGHTEGATDLMQLASLKPAAVISELMNKDGHSMNKKQIISFAKKYNIRIISVAEIVRYRLQTESLISEISMATIPLANYGEFKIEIIRERFSSKEHIVLSKPSQHNTMPTLIRIHSKCTTGDLFHSLRCDCHQQLHYALQKIADEGGILLYLDQEGRDIGLYDKIRAYALQEQGMNTLEANHALGHNADLRSYAIASHILKQKNLSSIRLLTNNPQKIEELKFYGITQITREPLPLFMNSHNTKYLHTKKTHFNHCFDHLHNQSSETVCKTEILE